jgi:hypothetical protein
LPDAATANKCYWRSGRAAAITVIIESGSGGLGPIADQRRRAVRLLGPRLPRETRRVAAYRRVAAHRRARDGRLAGALDEHVADAHVDHEQQAQRQRVPHQEVNGVADL